MAGLDWLTHDDFSGRVGETFEVRVGEVAVAVVLAETSVGAELGGPGPNGEERLQFSLVFAGPASPLLTQGTYPVSHGALGELDLFLVPIGPGAAGGMRYEAAFA